MSVNIDLNHSLVRITEDGLGAYLSLCPPNVGEQYALLDLAKILEKYNVSHGLRNKVLEQMLNNKDYFVEYLVAEGTPAMDGIDGEYEFFFALEQDKKPRILADGSVDYGSMKDVVSVEAGAVIARYKPSVTGEDGIMVTGRPIIAKKGREFPVLKGKGFVVSEDKKTYTASMTGKAEYENGRLRVTNMLTIDGDVNIITGDIMFGGDVQVTGNVVAGMVVEAKGSILVNGHVEGAKLIAGKDVVLKNGMQGNGNGEIRADRNVSGKFFEQTTVYAKGSIHANAILNCFMISEQEVIVSGKMGAIVGGSVTAIKQIEATIIGNISEVKTKLSLGVDTELYNHINKVKNKVEEITAEVVKYEAGMVRINQILQKAPNPEMAGKKLELMRLKISKDTQLTGLHAEVEDCERKITNSLQAKLVVRKSIYRGTKIIVNGAQKIIESENYNVFYIKENAEIVCKQNF